MTEISGRQRIFYMLQIVSCMGGFLLIAGLSEGGIWASVMVVLLIIFCSAGENLFLKRNKNIEIVHWTFSDWTLLAAGLLFIYASNLIGKMLLLCCMLISLYVNLYRTCYYEKVSFIYIRKIFSDLPILCFYNLPDFWRWEEPVEIRRKRRSWMIGMLALAGILTCIILPLYTATDANVGRIAVIFAEKISIVLPYLLLCAILGIIPAMINYSLIRGLMEDVVEKNPERCDQTLEIIPFESTLDEAVVSTVDKAVDTYISKESVFKIILWGMVAVNAILVGLQVFNLFQVLLSSRDMGLLCTMQGVLPLLTAIVINVMFMIFSQCMTSKEGHKKLKMVTLIYAFTLIALLLLLVGRYTVKILYSGIEEADLFGLLAILILSVALCIYLYGIFQKNVQLGGKVVLWGTVLFVLLSVIPIEYFIAEINVQVFINKLDQHQIGEYVSKDDIDLEYLGTLGYDAVPAMARLLQISLPYGNTSESVGRVVKYELLDIFDQDINEEERVQISEKSAEDGVRQLVDILMKNKKYQIIGKRKISLQALAESVGVTIN